jgi:anti-sigma factor ChrR (cupin superfamily)
MNHSKKGAPLTVEQQESAALAALGFLSPGEAMATPRMAIVHMSEAAALLAESVAPMAPAPSLKGRLLSRVADFELLKPVADVRRDENTWVHSGMPGIDIKPLFKESATGRNTYLVRMEPGARMAPHHHGDIEQCLVVKGDVRWGSLVFEEGDFMVMGKDTAHPEVHTVNGVIMLIISGHNEFHLANAT